MKPRILVSNDDGIDAPGLRAVVLALAETQRFDVCVCAPAAEKSATSHAITVRHALELEQRLVPGASIAWAVQGTPADSVRVALNSDLFGDEASNKFDLVVSGINRGDNLGLHVIYSGTVGAAREAAVCGYPALATSLDDYAAHDASHYAASARVVARFSLATLGLLPGQQGRPVPRLGGFVVNLNFPAGPVDRMVGVAHCTQGASCYRARFVAIDSHAGMVKEGGKEGAKEGGRTSPDGPRESSSFSPSRLLSSLLHRGGGSGGSDTVNGQQPPSLSTSPSKSNGETASLAAATATLSLQPHLHPTSSPSNQDHNQDHNHDHHHPPSLSIDHASTNALATDANSTPSSTPTPTPSSAATTHPLPSSPLPSSLSSTVLSTRKYKVQWGSIENDEYQDLSIDRVALVHGYIAASLQSLYSDTLPPPPPPPPPSSHPLDARDIGRSNGGMNQSRASFEYDAVNGGGVGGGGGSSHGGSYSNSYRGGVMRMSASALAMINMGSGGGVFKSGPMHRAAAASSPVHSAHGSGLGLAEAGREESHAPPPPPLNWLTARTSRAEEAVQFMDDVCEHAASALNLAFRSYLHHPPLNE